MSKSIRSLLSFYRQVEATGHCEDGLEVSVLNNIPDIVLGQILSYLHWKEKCNLAETNHRVNALLNSSLGWECFVNSRNCPTLLKTGPVHRISELEKSVVKKYGKYFQHCELRLDMSDFEEKKSPNNSSSIVQLVSDHCKHIKSLCIFHPSQLTYPQIVSSYRSFIRPIQKLLSRRKGKCSLLMKRTFYGASTCALDLDKYVFLLMESTLHLHLTCFDVSSGQHNETFGIWPVLNLIYFKNLRVLKCSVQAVNESIILSLLQSRLVHLFLRNDHNTSRVKFLEAAHLHWQEIYRAAPAEKRETFKVHYIFQNRVLKASDLTFNPFARSLVFENLLSSISQQFLNRIVDLYSPFITTLAFCSDFWEFSMHFTDIGSIDARFKSIGLCCARLSTFLSCIHIPSSSLYSLANNSKSLVNLHVYKHKVRLSNPQETAESFQQNISQALDINNWKMIVESNIFSIPGIDPLLFSSCDTYCFQNL